MQEMEEFEIIASDAPRAMQICYCEISGYREKVMDAIEKMKEHGLNFNWYLHADETRTGRLDMIIYNTPEP
jgi:hypothetical protein